MKKVKLCLCIIIFVVIAVIFCLSLKQEKGQNMNVRFDLGKEQIKLWKNDESYYLFLPSYADREKVKLNKNSDELEFPDLQMELRREDTIEAIPVGETISCKNKKTQEPFSFIIMQSENLPAVYIDTKSGTMENVHADKEYKENAKILVKNANGKTLYNKPLAYIKGRANATWSSYEKKPYLIELKEENSLLDLAKGKKWVLITNASDPTLIRNELTYRMATAMEMTNTKGGKFIDLYLNGIYAGNYYLTSKIEISETRLSLSNLEEENARVNKGDKLKDYLDYIEDNKKGKLLEQNPDDITGGYLIEREFSERFWEEYDKNPSSFSTTAGEDFVVQSPKYCSKEQIQYISSYVQEVEEAILSADGYNAETGKKYTEYIDLNSFVKKYLLEEVSKNYDGGVSSSFFYKDRDSISTLLYAGPAWDYDMTFGNRVNWMGGYQADPKGVSYLTSHTFMTCWAKALCEKEEFDTLVRKNYSQYIAPYLQELYSGGIDELRSQIRASANMDHARWHSERELSELNQDIEALKSFVKERKAFLDAVWVKNEKYCMLKFMDAGEVYDIRYIKQGERIGELPQIGNESKILEGWYDIDTGTCITPDEVASKDQTLEARFIQVDD